MRQSRDSIPNDWADLSHENLHFSTCFTKAGGKLLCF